MLKLKTHGLGHQVVVTLACIRNIDGIGNGDTLRILGRLSQPL